MCACGAVHDWALPRQAREEGKLPEYGMLVYTGPIDSYFAQQASHPHSVVSPRMVLLPATQCASLMT